MFGPKPWLTPDMARLAVEAGALRRRIKDKRVSLLKQEAALEVWAKRLDDIEAARADFRHSNGPVKNPQQSVDKPVDPA